MVAQEIFPFSEFDYRSDDACYTHSCRCGGKFEVGIAGRDRSNRFIRRKLQRRSSMYSARSVLLFVKSCTLRSSSFTYLFFVSILFEIVVDACEKHMNVISFLEIITLK